MVQRSLLLAVIALAVAAGVPAQTRIRVMTFNVRYDFEDDDANRWHKRKEVVARTIEAAGASIVCIQEDKEDQVADLEGLLPAFGFVGRGRNETGSGERCSILYRKDHVAVADSGSFWLSERPDEAGSKFDDDSYPRVVTWALFKTKNRKQVLVLSAHLADGRDKDDLRSKQAAVIRRWLVTKLGMRRGRPDPRLPVVVAGDFNAEADGPVRQTLADSGDLRLRDAWEEGETPRGWAGTYHGFEGRGSNKRMDWLLVGGPVRVRAAGKYEEEIDGRYPSDHYPVHADIEWR